MQDNVIRTLERKVAAAIETAMFRAPDNGTHPTTLRVLDGLLLAEVPEFAQPYANEVRRLIALFPASGDSERHALAVALVHLLRVLCHRADVPLLTTRPPPPDHSLR